MIFQILATLLNEPCRVYGVYEMPLFNGENLVTPASREWPVQMFLERIEDGENPVLCRMF